MSRPQFPVQTQSPGLAAHVVNGGLIDFQDNFHRGVPDFGAMMAAQQSGQHLQGLLQSYQNPMHSGFQSPASFQSVASAMGSVPQQTVLGHPSFINVGGKMYKPVEEPTTAVAAPPPDQKKDPVMAAPVRISDEDLDRRVELRLAEWMSTRKERPTARGRNKMQTDEDRAAARIKSVNAGMRKGLYSPA